MKAKILVSLTLFGALLTGDILMSQIAPRPEQVQELRESTEEGPVVMVNLLRFKDEADAPDEGVSGAEAYSRYGEQMIQWVTSQGGRLIWSGRVDSQFIGDTEERFDTIAIVEYPSRAEFQRIVSDPRVAEWSVHRTAGLDMQWLIATTTTDEIAGGSSGDAP